MTRPRITRVGTHVVLYAGLPQHGTGVIIETTARNRRWLRAFFRRALRLDEFVTVRADTDGHVRLRSSRCIEEINA